MAEYDSVILRRAANDFTAMQTADAMQSLSHVEVVAITYRPNVLLPWHIFAKYSAARVLPPEIDDAISEKLNALNEE